MMTLDECIAAARLPIVVEYIYDIERFEMWHDYWITISYNSTTATKRYVALRTRLSEQQGEKR